MGDLIVIQTFLEYRLTSFSFLVWCLLLLSGIVPAYLIGASINRRWIEHYRSKSNAAVARRVVRDRLKTLRAAMCHADNPVTALNLGYRVFIGRYVSIALLALSTLIFFAGHYVPGPSWLLDTLSVVCVGCWILGWIVIFRTRNMDTIYRVMMNHYRNASNVVHLIQSCRAILGEEGIDEVLAEYGFKEGIDSNVFWPSTVFTQRTA